MVPAIPGGKEQGSDLGRNEGDSFSQLNLENIFGGRENSAQRVLTEPQVRDVVQQIQTKLDTLCQKEAQTSLFTVIFSRNASSTSGKDGYEIYIQQNVAKPVAYIAAGNNAEVLNFGGEIAFKVPIIPLESQSELARRTFPAYQGEVANVELKKAAFHASQNPQIQ